MVLTSDVIVGFPGETEAEFEETPLPAGGGAVRLPVYLYLPPGGGPPAAQMEDPTPMAEKGPVPAAAGPANRISLEKHQAYVGRTLPVLVEEENDADPVNNLNCRTDGWRLVHVPGDPEHVGQRKLVKITGCSTWSLFGAFVEEA